MDNALPNLFHYFSNAKNAANALFLCSLGFATLYATVALWQNSPLLMLCLAVMGALILWFGYKNRAHIIYPFGFLIGAIAEILGTSSGAWEYAKPEFMGIPYWLPFVWGIAAVFLVGIWRHFSLALVEHHHEKQNPLNVLLAIALALEIIMLFSSQPAAVASALAAIGALLLAKRVWKDWWLFAFAFFAGTAAEATAISSGAWHYSPSQIGGVTFWLPFLWGIVALMFIDVWGFLDSHLHKKGQRHN
jgi:uncharacterized membrane protein YoaT (DUF817 family)